MPWVITETVGGQRGVLENHHDTPRLKTAVQTQSKFGLSAGKSTGLIQSDIQVTCFGLTAPVVCARSHHPICFFVFLTLAADTPSAACSDPTHTPFRNFIVITPHMGEGQNWGLQQLEALVERSDQQGFKF